MSADRPEITVGSCGDALYIDVRGRATQRICPTADKLVRSYLEAHGAAATVIVDIGGCGWLDSTFAGWLAGLHKKLPGRVTITGCGDNCHNSIARMNLQDLFQFADVPAPAESETITCLTRDQPTKPELQLMLSAHEQLAAVSDSNARIFSPIVEMLRRQLETA